MLKKAVALLSGLILVSSITACSSSKTVDTSGEVAYASGYETSGNEVADLFYNGDYMDCIDAATAIMNQNGESVENLTYRGVAWAKLNKPYAAFHDLIAATKMEYNSATLLNLGNALRMFGYCARAIDAYQQALALEPDNQAILMNMTSAYFCYGANAQANETFTKLIPNFPKDAVAFTNAAILKHSMGDYQQSITAGRKALEFDAFYKPAWFMIRTSCRADGDRDCADNAEKQYNMLNGQNFRQRTRPRNP